MNPFEIIKTVRLTEKGTRQGEKFNQYTVVADRRANKTEIRQAVQELFKVKVTKVNTLNVRGKSRRQRTTQAGKAPDWKKAIVTLKAGDKVACSHVARQMNEPVFPQGQVCMVGASKAQGNLEAQRVEPSNAAA